MQDKPATKFGIGQPGRRVVGVAQSLGELPVKVSAKDAQGLAFSEAEVYV